jgi:hypothetical protein
MTDDELDAILRRGTLNEFVEDILTRIVAELPRRSTGSANALLGSILKSMYERGATAAINHNQQYAADEADEGATRH